MKNENWVNKLEEAIIKESRDLFMKQKLHKQLTKTGSLWLKEEHIDEKLPFFETDNEKTVSLKMSVVIQVKILFNLSKC